MTGFNHAITGAFVAAVFNEPLISLPAAFASHFVADAIPHWNYQVKGGLRARHAVMAADLLFSLVLLLILTATVNATPWLVFAGGIAGIAPDTMWLPYFLTGKPSNISSQKNPLHLFRRFHFWIQWSETAKGLYVEFIWFFIMLWLIYQI